MTEHYPVAISGTWYHFGRNRIEKKRRISGTSLLSDECIPQGTEINLTLSPLRRRSQRKADSIVGLVGRLMPQLGGFELSTPNNKVYESNFGSTSLDNAHVYCIVYIFVLFLSINNTGLVICLFGHFTEWSTIWW